MTHTRTFVFRLAFHPRATFSAPLDQWLLDWGRNKEDGDLNGVGLLLFFSLLTRSIPVNFG